MVWNEQQSPQSPTPQALTGAPAPQGTPGVSAQSVPPTPPAAADPGAGYPAGNPLQPVMTPQVGVAGAESLPAANSPIGAGAAPQPMPPLASQMPLVQGVAPAAAMTDDGQVPADDVVWVNRAKRAVAETHGDPHRKVQLIQHLRSVYLKQRFGRTVHTDEA